MSSSQWVVKISRDGFTLYSIGLMRSNGLFGSGLEQDTEILSTPGVDNIRYRNRGLRPNPFVLELIEPITDPISTREKAYQSQHGTTVTLEVRTNKIRRVYPQCLCNRVQIIRAQGGEAVGFGSVPGSDTTLVSRWVLLPMAAAEDV